MRARSLNDANSGVRACACPTRVRLRAAVAEFKRGCGHSDTAEGQECGAGQSRTAQRWGYSVHTDAAVAAQSACALFPPPHLRSRCLPLLGWGVAVWTSRLLKLGWSVQTIDSSRPHSPAPPASTQQVRHEAREAERAGYGSDRSVQSSLSSAGARVDLLVRPHPTHRRPLNLFAAPLSLPLQPHQP